MTEHNNHTLIYGDFKAYHLNWGGNKVSTIGRGGCGCIQSFYFNNGNTTTTTSYLGGCRHIVSVDVQDSQLRDFIYSLSQGVGIGTPVAFENGKLH